MKDKKTEFTKLIAIASVTALAGYVLSGPIAFVTVKAIKPQPSWISSSVFAQNYHVIQDLPYYFGFLLTGGMLMLSAAHYLNYSKEENEVRKFHLLVAFGWAVAFFTLISFNYICQTTYVRNLALHYKPEYDFAIDMFTMSNPSSLCWAIEMWGYGFLGISTWLGAGYYKYKNTLIYALMISNGVVSTASAIFTVIDASWVLTIAGLVSYLTWNVLMIALMVLIYRFSWKQFAAKV